MTKVEATKAAKKLLKRMKGRNWELRVWDNLGWHYCVECTPREDVWIGCYPTFRNDHKQVYVHDKPVRLAYYALVGSGRGRGWGPWTTQSTHTDPNEAVDIELKSAKKEATKIMQLAIDAELAIKK